MSFEKFENNKSLPEENELPLKVKESSAISRGGESTVWKTLTEAEANQDKLIALKQVRREEFADDVEMRKSKEFYDFLKSFPEFGKFVPETMYFKARMIHGDKPQSYSLQRFIEGKSIEKLKDEELYNDPVVSRQLLDFANAAVNILRATRKAKIIKPDFGTAFEADARAQFFGNQLTNPRYSTNIVIADKPNENGQRVFFVDTGQNTDERTKKMTAIVRREIGGRLYELQFKRWAKKLEGILANER